jgi:NAD+ dependent glucose-6-phosphate dehydrogenase
VTGQTIETVVLTGANGDIGRALSPALAETYRLRRAVWDLGRPPDAETDWGTPGEDTADDVRRVDVADLDGMIGLTEGANAIVHLAGQRLVDATWDQLRGPNVEGVRNLFEAARVNKVAKVVFASSNHATGHYDDEKDWPIAANTPPRADSLYGVTKALGEVLGRYASDYYGIDVICLRIGWVLERPHNEQALRMWLSHRDLRQLVLGCLASDVRYGIYYGVSANQRCHWDISNARQDLGYAPVDDSEIFAKELGL